jgi:16S rRNA (uracil1498-N3)-methyltransferase
MQLFYTPGISSNLYSLNEEESRHCLKVLRLQKGDIVHLTNGTGTLYKAKIIHIDKNNCEVEIVETIEEYGKKNYYLHIAIAPTKNTDRFEWFLEKATEIGIDEITPLICERSVKEKLRIERLNKVITSAVKQSLKAYHPSLNEASQFKDFLKKKFDGDKMIAYCNDEKVKCLSQVYKSTQNALVLIGPEGDFTNSEIELALKNNFTPVSLGKSRLRTETAGLYACTVINALNEI